MGTPVSPIVASLYTLKKEPSRKQLTPIHLVVRVLQESEVEQFTQHLNYTDDNTFTVEAEQNKKLALLDTCICLKDDESTKMNKRSVVGTLLQRAESLISEKEDKTKEV